MSEIIFFTSGKRFSLYRREVRAPDKNVMFRKVQIPFRQGNGRNETHIIADRRANAAKIEKERNAPYYFICISLPPPFKFYLTDKKYVSRKSSSPTEKKDV